MKKCPNCGKEFQDDWEVCLYCSVKLSNDLTIVPKIPKINVKKENIQCGFISRLVGYPIAVIMFTFINNGFNSYHGIYRIYSFNIGFRNAWMLALLVPLVMALTKNYILEKLILTFCVPWIIIMNYEGFGGLAIIAPTTIMLFLSPILSLGIVFLFLSILKKI